LNFFGGVAVVEEVKMQAVSGLSARELSRVRGRLLEYASEMLESMRRKDQRRWGEVYLRGLMLDGKRKSIEPMATRLADGDEQCLQQFVSQSPWDWRPVRRRLAVRMVGELAPVAWAIDDTGFPKFGRESVGVARQYCGALGKIGNCQVGVSVSAVCDEASCPIDWRLFIPQEWDQDSERRAKCRVPEQERHRPKWELAIEMLDELAGWGLTPPVIVSDAGYGEITEFRQALAERGLSFVLQVKGATSVLGLDAQPELRPWKGLGKQPVARYHQRRASLRELALAAGEKTLVEVSWREGSRGELRSRFLALRVRPANVKLRRAAANAGRELPVNWMLVEWPAGAEEPVKYWLADLPDDTPLQHLVLLAKVRWRIEHDYRELKDALGLDHFEGRSYPGWHHHVTLVSVAHGFLTLERRRSPRTRAAA
jgi:SRSO17 transposase